MWFLQKTLANFHSNQILFKKLIVGRSLAFSVLWAIFLFFTLSCFVFNGEFLKVSFGIRHVTKFTWANTTRYEYSLERVRHVTNIHSNDTIFGKEVMRLDKSTFWGRFEGLASNFFLIISPVKQIWRWREKKKDLQIKKLLIVKRILLVSTLGDA